MRVLFAALLAVAVAVSPAQAEEARKFSQAELDQTLAPVALYPDALLSQVLMAATYPLEIVEAARWSKGHPGIQGDDAVRAVQDKDWDPSVKSLVAFPNLLARMDENLEWTRRLGDAFLAQEADVMDTIQALRQRAKAEGKLESDERQRVTADGQTIVIEQANPSVVYVPYYDPYVVYGSWWWPGYPPYYWAPWPGYVVGYPGFWWGVGVGVTAGFFFGGFAWHHHHVAVVYPGAYYARPVAAYYRPYGYPPKQLNAGKWQHDKWHRRGVGERYETRRANAMPPAGFRASGDHRGQERAGDRRGDGRQGDHRGYERAGDQRGFEGRGERRAVEGRGEPRTDMRRADAPRTQPGGDAQRQQPRFESPRAQPRSEGSRALPRAQAPSAPPRAQAPSAPTRSEAPRAQPRVEAPRAMPRMESRGGEIGRGWGGGGGAARGWSGGGESRGGSAGGGFRGGSGGGGRGGGGQGRG
jgi:hypothetical protein